MDHEQDLAALGAITAAESSMPSDPEASQQVKQAVANTDLDNIDAVLIDFSNIHAEAARADGLSIAAEKLRTDGKIDVLTAQGLTAISKTILGSPTRKHVYTEVPTKVGLSKAIESLLAEEEAARSQASIAVTELITRAGKCAQERLNSLKAESRKALVDLATSMADFSDEFYSVNLNDVILNNGELNMFNVLNDRVCLTDPLFGDQSMFFESKEHLAKIVLGKDISSVPRWINQGHAYISCDQKLIDVAVCVQARAFEDKSSFYAEDQADVRLIYVMEAAGSPNQTLYEDAMAAGVTEGIYQLSQLLPKQAEEGQEPTAQDASAVMVKAMYITKVISAILRALMASVEATHTAVDVYRGVCNNTRPTTIETT